MLKIDKRSRYIHSDGGLFLTSIQLYDGHQWMSSTTTKNTQKNFFMENMVIDSND